MLGSTVLATIPLALSLAFVAPASGSTVETEVTVPAGSEVEIEAPVSGEVATGEAATGEAAAPTEDDGGDASEAATLPTIAPPLQKRKLPQPEYGPFYEPEAPADAVHASDRPLLKPPALSVANGAFCFVEDARCGISLIASADIGVGLNIPAGDRGVEVPMSQFGFRGGVTFRPVTLARRRWNRWAVGLTAAYARSSGALATTFSSSGGDMPDFIDVTATNATRFALLNQLWLSQKRHALHLDFALGVVRSEVLTSAPQKFLGTHADLALGVGGWGSFFVAGDFLDQDTRLVFGLRGHAIAAAPIVAMVFLGLLAGGGL